MNMIFIPQVDANDCGFASLSMIAKYYNSNSHNEVIHSMFHIDKCGISLL